ncbi:MAG: GNAT family N-acetyltransferase [Chloroflexi bacterium]|nr:GNAT family N-acetyltransferase [Chloroflexota bacterium]
MDEGRISFRRYRPNDQAACLALFEGNCPAFFAPNERSDYLGFLEAEPLDYKVGLIEGRIVCAFGLQIDRSEGTLKWMLVCPQQHAQGIGTGIMEHVLSESYTAGVQLLRIAASHKSAPFFARFGAQPVDEIPNGWGPGMHRVDMEMRLESISPSPD